MAQIFHLFFWFIFLGLSCLDWGLFLPKIYFFLSYSELKFGNRVDETNLSNVTWTISIVVQLFFLVKNISERSYTSTFGIRFFKAFDSLNLNLKQFLENCFIVQTPQHHLIIMIILDPLLWSCFGWCKNDVNPNLGYTSLTFGFDCNNENHKL